MASHGIVSIALDFRSGNEDPYPASVQDINYAVRWAKAQRARRSRPGPSSIGLSGQSSGGHLAMLVAMRPHDPRYAAIPLPAGSPAHDASVRCVVMSWPVINPLSRYRHAKRAQARRQSAGMAEVASSRARTPIGGAKPTWRRATRCSRSSAARRCCTPPAIWFQGRGDMLHDYKDAESRFPRQRAAALRRQLPQGRRRDRARIYRDGAPRRPFAGPVADRRHVRAHGGVRGQAHQGRSKLKRK